VGDSHLAALLRESIHELQRLRAGEISQDLERALEVASKSSASVTWTCASEQEEHHELGREDVAEVRRLLERFRCTSRASRRRSSRWTARAPLKFSLKPSSAPRYLRQQDELLEPRSITRVQPDRIRIFDSGGWIRRRTGRRSTRVRAAGKGGQTRLASSSRNGLQHRHRSGINGCWRPLLSRR
jgi:hypothetical protein